MDSQFQVVEYLERRQNTFHLGRFQSILVGFFDFETISNKDHHSCIVCSLVHSDYLAAVRLNNIPLEMYFWHLTTMTLSVHSLSQHFGCIWLWNVNSDGILEVGTRFCYPSYGSNTNSLCKNLILNILLYKLSFSRSKPYHLIHIILSIHWWLSWAVSGYWYHAIFANSHLLAGGLII